MERDKAKFDILNKILEERTKRGWSEYTLAQNSGLTQSTISTWYRKDLQPSVASIEKVCNGLGITLSQFFADYIPENPVSLNQEQMDLLSLWNQLTPAQRKAVMDMLRSFTGDYETAPQKLDNIRK